MRRCIGAAVAIALFAISGVALAGYTNGKYEGSTAQGEDLSFVVTPRDKVKRISYVVRGRCQNGANFSFTNSPDPNAVNINKRGRFRETVQGTQSPSEATIRGKIKDNGRAHGIVEAHTRGPVGNFGRCSTPDVDWHARR